MENIQINGQKIWGPPKGWMGPPPPHGTEVFIKNIPDDVFEEDLYYLFSTVGKVYEVRLPVHWTGMNKGYAFVRFTKIAEADAAIEMLNLSIIRPGKPIRVERSLDNTRLFLSSVPNDKSGEDIKSDLLTVVENVKTVYVYPALENPTMFRGYAFVEFVCHRDAAIAKRILTPDVLFNLFERKCIAAWANPLPFLNKETLKNINILFMRNIPSQTKSISIRMAVDSLISPESVHKVKRLNDYAFLTFKSHEMAERAMIKIKSNPFLLGMKAVHVEWAIPRDLANSLSAKNLDPEEDNKSEQNCEPDIQSCQSLFKILEDYKNRHPQILIEDYNNPDVENTENTPIGCFPNTNLRILQRQPSEFESLSVFNKADLLVNKTKLKNTFNQHKVDKPNAASSLMLETIYNKQNIANQRNSSGGRNLITEFRYPDSEDFSRDVHLKNWLQSLTITDQYKSCATSPTLTSSSTGSTNLSWKWEENGGQTSSGSATSPEYDVKDYNAKMSPKISQFDLF